MKTYQLLGLATGLAALACLACNTPPEARPAPAAPADPVAQAFGSLAIAAPSRRNPPKAQVMVHYMPWYQAPPVSKAYGWHWHMGYFEPGTLTAEGDPSIASHYPPLSGPYDSADPWILEYQTLLMKIAGIDGVIADWYGSENVLDYAQIHRNTEALFSAAKAAGLSFALCYEDQSVGKAVEAGAVTRDGAMEYARVQFARLGKTWLADPAYLKIADRPVLLNFGPQYFLMPDQWKTLFAELPVRPLFIGLDNHMEFFTDGSYPWMPMSSAVHGVLDLDTLANYLNGFYRGQKDKPWLVASAWPRFHDIYQEAKVAKSYGYLGDNDGETFRLTLEAARAAKPDLIQIATWNDYGEGTVIEPTTVTGYRDLETLQALKRSDQPDFPWMPADLRLPLQLLNTRRAGANAAVMDRLKSAILAGRVDEARAIAATKPFSAAALAAGAPIVTPPKLSGAAGADPFAGKTNLAPGKRTSATGHTAAFTADLAVDGETASYWEGKAQAWPNEFVLDLGSAQAISGVRLKLNPKRIWEARVQNIELRASLDGTGYATVAPARDWQFDPEIDRNSVAIPLAATLRYLKLVFAGNTGASAGQLAELEVFTP